MHPSESDSTMRLGSGLSLELGEIILVALSGGPDSMALLRLLLAEGYSVHAAHVHHHLRSEEADADAQFCAQFCQEREIPFTLIHVDVSGERGKSGGGVQEVARRLRYGALERCALEVGASVIATGHNRDDNAETILLNILRGTGLDGLRGIPRRRGKIVRPLLDVSRAEIEAYCAGHGLSPRRDSSNASTKYARNEVRHKLMPYLRERFNERVDDALLRLAKLASDESDFVDAEASRWLAGRQGFTKAELSQLPVALQRRVLRLWLREERSLKNVSFEYIEQLRDIDSDTGRTILTGEPSRKEPHAMGSEPVVPIEVPGSARFSGWQVSASGSLPYGSTSAAVRFWRYGDRMRFNFGRRKLSDLFGEAKWTEAARYRTPLLVDASSQEVLAIANWRVSPLAPYLTFSAERVELTAS